jgi:hypothetical protein
VLAFHLPTTVDKEPKTLQNQLETDLEELNTKKQVETLTTLRKLDLQKLSYSDKKSLVDKLISSI